MSNEWNKKLLSSSLKSEIITHTRIKYLAKTAGYKNKGEDHISRLGLGLSLRKGSINMDWRPKTSENEKGTIQKTGKTIKGSTLFKSEAQLILFNAALFQIQTPNSYEELRAMWITHWERGIEELMQLTKTNDWIDTMSNLQI